MSHTRIPTPPNNMKPGEAFKAVFSRVKYLDNKIEELHHDPRHMSDAKKSYYHEERDALLWIVWKMVEQAGRLVDVGRDTGNDRAVLLRNEPVDYYVNNSRVGSVIHER